mgnify:FL=1
MGSSPIFRIIKETSGDSPEVFFYCTEAIPEPRVQVFAPLRSAQSTRPPDELRPPLLCKIAKLKTDGIDTGFKHNNAIRAKSQNIIDISLEVMYALSRIGNSSFKGDDGFYEI